MNLTLFFIQTPPGLESLALKELKEKWPLISELELPPCKELAGGIELELPMEWGLTLNKILKIPNRILIRELEFKCRDLPKLFNKIKKHDWTHYFPGIMPTLHISSAKSRLIHTKKIESSLKQGLEAAFKAKESKQKIKERASGYLHFHLFVRFFDDVCTVSIDTSGERLGLRGYRPHQSMAPIRENLAAACFYAISPFLRNGSTLIDPMCGSGTLLLEAATFYQQNKRDFSFNYFSFFKEGPKIPETLKEIKFNLQGFDNDEGQMEAISKSSNLANSPIKFSKRDALEVFKDEIKDVVILSNPPYGKRVPIDEKRFFHKLIKSLANSYHPLAMALIVPRNVFNEKGELQFQNGGIPVKLWLKVF